MKTLSSFIQSVLQVLTLSVLLCSMPASALVLLDSYTDGQGGVLELSGVHQLLLSPDNQYLYACAFNDEAVSVFSRDSNEGRLTFIEHHKQGQNNVSGLRGAFALSLSPDTQHLYVAGFLSNAIAIFSRNASDGRLSFVQEMVGDTRNALNRVNGLSLDTQGKNLYATSDDGVGVFSRDSQTGLLNFVALYQNTTPGMQGLSGATAARVSHDGLSVYVTGRNDNGLVFFERNPDTGGLSFSQFYANGLNGITGLGGAYDVQISADDSLVFVSGNSDAAIVAFQRAAGGALTYLQTYQNNVGGVQGLSGVQSLTLSDDGSRLFAVGNSDNAVVMFDVLGASSALDPLRFFQLVKDGEQGINTLSGLNSIAVDSQSRQVYTSALNVSSLTVLSLDSADLSLSMTALADTPLDSTFSYTLHVENLGPGVANDVVLTDTLPSALSFNAASSDSRCSATGQQITCVLDVLTASQTLDVLLSVTANEAGTVSNTASISSSDLDGDSSNNSASASIDIISQLSSADVGISLSVDTDPVNISSTFTYQMQLSNAGPSDANNVVVLLSLPSGSSFVSTQAGQGVCTSLDSTQIRCTQNSLTANNPSALSVTVRSPNQATEITATASISANETDLNTSNDSASVSSQVEVITTDLQLLGAFPDRLTVTVGEVLTYEAGMRNLASTAAQDVIFEALLTPASGLRYVSASTTNPNVTTPFSVCNDQGQGVVRCELGTLDALGSPVSVQLSVLPISSGTLNARFALSNPATDTDTSNNTFSAEAVEMTGEPIDVALALTTVTPNVGFIGNPLAFQLTASNTNTSSPASNVVVTMTLPADVDYVGAVTEQGSGCSETAGTVTCALGNMSISGSTRLTLTVRPTTEADVAFSAQLSTGSFDPDNTNDVVSRTVSVQPATVDLQVTGSISPDPVVVDDELQMLFTVVNAGPSQANNTQFTLSLPTAGTYLLLSAAVAGGNDCTLAADVLSCDLGLLSIQAASNIEVRLLPHEAGLFSATATLQSSVQDTQAANDSLTLSSLVNQPLALSQGQVYVEGQNGITGLQSLFGLLISQDGQYLYATSFNQAGVVVLQREASNGDLSVIQFLSNQDVGVSGLGGGSTAAFSSDEKWLYVPGFIDDSLVVLQRNASNGLLSFAQVVSATDTGLEALQGPYAVTTQDNFVYVADFNSDAVLVLQQQGTDSSQLVLLDIQQNGIGAVNGLNGINHLTVSADGAQLYTSSALDSSVTVFDRDLSSGLLSFKQALRNENSEGGITGLNGASHVLSSPDNQYVYAAGGADMSVVTFKRGADGRLQYLQTLTDNNGLNNVSDLKLSQNGDYLYAAATNNNALTLLGRTPSTGLLSLQHILANGTDGIQGLDGIRAIAISPDAQHVYTASLNGNAITLFRLPNADVSVSMTATNVQPNTGQDLTYRFLVSNNGTDRATSTTLSVQIPAGLSPLSYSSTGFCEMTSAALTCHLGSLNAGAATNVSLTVVADSAGERMTTASVTASQSDELPDNNTVSQSIEVMGVANLVVSLDAAVPFTAQEAEIQYQINLINAGPDAASQIVLTDVLPPQVAFISAQLNAIPCTFNDPTVTCLLDTLANQARVVGEIRVRMLDTSSVTNSLLVTSTSLDLNQPNQASLTLPVAQTVINSEINNQGQVLRDVWVTADGVIRDGTVAGTLQNQGLLDGVSIAPGALIMGGRLSGVINHQGTLQDVELLAGSTLNGGRVQGLIQGTTNLLSSLLPRLSNVQVAAGTELRYLVIDNTVTLDAATVLGTGLKFTALSDIPLDKDISGLFPVLTETQTQGQALDVNYSPEFDSRDTVLNGLNTSPDMFGLQFQATAWGHLFFDLSGALISAVPVQIMRTANPSSLQLTASGAAHLITPNQFDVLLQPALRNPAALSYLLQSFGLEAQAQVDGNLNIPLPNNSGRLLLRPDWVAVPAGVDDPGDSPAALGFQAISTIPTMNYAVMFFDDGLGMRRQQVLYPVAADINAWHTAQNQGDMTQLNIQPNGLIAFSQNGQDYQGVFDIFVLPGGTGSGHAVSVQDTTDQNGDNLPDLLVTYPDGDTQKIFVGQ